MTATLGQADIEGFRSWVAQQLGLYFDDSRLDSLVGVLQQRMESAGLNCFSSYREHLTANTQEMRVLAELLTVCETYFFRYAEQFQSFAEVVVPGRIRARAKSRQLRILSAGCSSGEEAYSLAILVRDALPELSSWDVTIQAIDVNPAILAKALQGRYPIWSLRDTPAPLQSKYFHKQGRELALDDKVRSMVTFEERNLIEEDPLFWRRDAFDVVFCRNVTMYFATETTRQIIARIARSIMPGGFLFLGHAETLRNISQEFHLRHTHETFYYQRRTDHDELGHEVKSLTGSGKQRLSQTFIPPLVEPDVSWFDVIRRASERIANLTDGKNDRSIARSGNIAAKSPLLESTPAPSWDRNRALELLQNERFAEAIEMLQGLPLELKADPDAQLLLAIVLTNHGDLPEAEKVCLRLLKLDELNSGAHYLMALCREHAGDHVAAAEHDQAAAYLDPAFAMPHLHLGLVAKRSADIETASQELNKALTLLAKEDASRILFFGGGFTRQGLSEFCRAELRACGGQ